MVKNESTPETHLIPCNFDETEKLLMVCWPGETFEEPADWRGEASCAKNGRTTAHLTLTLADRSLLSGEEDHV